MPTRFTERSLRAASLLLLAALACGGGQAEPSREPAPSTEAGEPAASPEEKLRAAQESAVEAMCERLVDCAVEEARKNMSPDEVAKLDVEQTGRKLRDECEAEGAQKALSPRQIRVVQRCVTQPGTCDELQTCLDEAKKRD
jgi:hypothetical protein